MLTAWIASAISLPYPTRRAAGTGVQRPSRISQVHVCATKESCWTAAPSSVPRMDAAARAKHVAQRMPAEDALVASR